MVSSLFSMFDPSSSLITFWGIGKWVVVLFPMVVMDWASFPVNTSSGSVMSMLIFGMKDIYMSLMKFYGKWTIIFGVVVFFSLACWTGVGLVPYTFTLTSQLSVNFSMSMVLCLCGILNYMVVGKTKLLSHMLPLGAPMVLGPFLVLVETVSLVIRPLTLSLRLTANVVAGHLLVTLLSGMCSGIFISLGKIYSAVPVLLESGLLGFEMAVVVIQSYVFFILFSMYWAEVE